MRADFPMALAGVRASDGQSGQCEQKGAKPAGDYLILDSEYSTCFFAIGSYFRFFILSVCVREFFRVT
jgi:hypothetical protein